eukprot:scaffold7328_cov314-Pinguiococcus_pyrenoidosus.AAC.78
MKSCPTQPHSENSKTCILASGDATKNAKVLLSSPVGTILDNVDAIENRLMPSIIVYWLSLYLANLPQAPTTRKTSRVRRNARRFAAADAERVP